MSKFLEKDLETIIFENTEKIHTKGFEPICGGIKYRQFELPSGKKIDILCLLKVENDLIVHIIELKKDKCTKDAIFQALGYLDEFYDCVKFEYEEIHPFIIVVGFDIEKVSFTQWMNIPIIGYTYRYELDGISFKPSPKIKSNPEIELKIKQ